MRVVPDELETYQGVMAPTKKIVADKPDEGPIEMPKVSQISSSNRFLDLEGSDARQSQYSI